MYVFFFLIYLCLIFKEIEYLCYFDLFFIFFDLFGIFIDYLYLGIMLVDDLRVFVYLFYLVMLKGNMFVNFGFLFNDELFWVDCLFN